MAINVEGIVTNAAKKFEKKFMGGITEESARKALQAGIEEAATIGQAEVRIVQQKLSKTQVQSAQQIAELTKQKDRFERGVNQLTAERDQIAEELKAAQQVIEGAAKPIRGINPKGNIVEVSTNPRGRITKTVEKLPNKEETPISVTYTDKLGYKRTNHLDLGTGKVERTTTNTHGNHEYVYGEKGSVVIGSKSKKPVKCLSKDIIEKNLKNGIAKIKKTYSDGSYEIINYNINTKCEFSGYRINKYGKKISEFEMRGNNSEKMTTFFDEDRGEFLSSRLIEWTTNKGGKGSQETFYEYSEGTAKAYKKETIMPDGIKQIAEALQDQYGFFDRNHLTIKYLYPKSHKVKSSKITPVLNQGHYYANETIKLRDGRIIEAKISDAGQPFEIVVKSKDGKILETDFKAGRDLINSLNNRGESFQGSAYYFTNIY